MRYREFRKTGRRSVLDIAREIARLYEWPPISDKDRRWLVSMSRNENLISKLSKGASRVNHRAIALTDDQFLIDASDCAKAYRILYEIQEQIRRR